MSKNKYLPISLLLVFILLLGGCKLIESNRNEKNNPYMTVQDYTGQGFSFNNGEKTGEFAKHHKKEIIEQVDKYFVEKFGLKVTTHNLVGAKGAVVAFVESKQEPYFHASVVVGVDLKNKKVTGNVFAYEGHVEGAIISGLYVMAYEKEFKKLDEFCEMISKKYPVVGMRQEAVENTMDSGFSTPFYYTNTSKLDYPQIYNAFMKNHNVSSEELKDLISAKTFKAKGMVIGLTFYMKKKHSMPDKELSKEVIKEFKQSNGFPPGSYAVFIKSNEILTRVGKEKSYEGTTPGIDEIVVRQD